MAKNPFGVSADPLSENAFSKAEAGMKIDKVGNGSFGGMSLHAPSLPGGKSNSGRIQSPAQHASVKKAAQASVAKRKARTFGE